MSTPNHRSTSSASLAAAFHGLGYRPEDDAWELDGRRTYSHEDDATRDYLSALRGRLGGHGWHRDTHALRTFRHEATGEVIEIEPAGSDCSGHYLHHMKAAVAC
jgi:hypothetical protein